MWVVLYFFFKQKTAYEMRISDWSSDVCSSDLRIAQALLEVEVAGTDPAPAFAQGGKLRDYVMGQYAYNLAGIAEAFAVQLPERYGIELLDLIDDEWAAYDLLSGFRTSLLWRRQNAFTSRPVELLDEYEIGRAHV